MIDIRFFQNEDLVLLKAWLNKDYVKQFYGNPQEWIDEVTENLHLIDCWAYYYIAEFEGNPIGFVQSYDTHKAPQGDWSDTPPYTIGIDYMIGEEDFIGKGLGTVLVQTIINKIKSQNRFSHIIADPIPENTASIAVLTRNGFQLMPNGLYILDIIRVIKGDE